MTTEPVRIEPAYPRLTPEEAFLTAICDAPDDMAPRLMYADWLTERGDPRGEFIQVQMRIAALDPYHLSCAGKLCPGCSALKQREKELIEATPKPPKVGVLQYTNLVAWSGMEPVQLIHYRPKFRRGFVEAVSCTAAEWQRHGPALVRAAPLLEVRLTDRDPLQGNLRAAIGWHSSMSDTHAGNILPALFAKLSAGYPDGPWQWYETVAAANADISQACLKWARLPADQQ